MAFVRHQYWLAGSDKGSKVCRRDMLSQVEKTLGRKPTELLNAPRLPEELDYLWGIYLDLAGATISYTELQAYQDLTGFALAPFEVSIIMTASKEARHD